ncbi:S-layer homology domain-containing protein [Paenibacillus rhizovicinus]|uniref:S-layer homology domain-containing protein n=1 Tax=Paenibacillus rhizovicinus TaxID=2704463 RepID=A0A6C0P4F5_9BACL|nr:S-layer homology domain-containing protein [Paenibacillus rhizovicinus]QHW31552.1 S-layer homology domain-containing protein [Paenibacillus rhizovicinus]
MTKVLLNKTAGLIASLMIVSMLLPVLAFASAAFQNVSYNNGTVTGTVYVDDATYSLLNGNNVVVHVYGDGNKFLGTTNAVYGTYGKYTFSFDVASATYATYATYSTYFPYTLKYFYPGNAGSVTDTVYDPSSNIGGGVFFPGTGSIVDSNGNVDGNALSNLFASNKNASITTTSDVVLLPADALIKGESLTIAMADGTSYTLPIAALKLEELAKSLGVELKDLVIRVEMKQLTGDAAAKVTDAVYAAGGKQVAPAIDFKVIAVAGSKQQEITTFGQYVTRTIGLNEVAADTTGLVGVLFNPVTGELSFVPTTFASTDDQTIASLQRNGNSIYTVVQAKAVSFADLAGNWAQKDVEALASKLIVKGTSATKFEPKRNITRAEFAALVVRALGLEVSGSTSKFKDVASDKWYAATIATAVNAGLITGYEDGTFKPNANITRKELAAIVTRAIKFAGKDVTLTDAQLSAALASFKDAASLGWAKDEVAVAVSEGIVKGQTATMVVGDANANRAEAATMIARFLGDVGFVK